MSVQADFFALAGPILAGRLYPNVAPDTPTAPYATYFRVSAVEGATLDINGGTGNEVGTRIQCDVWATTYSEAQSKASAIRAALKGWAVENVVLLEQDFYEPDTKLHRVMLDISTWHF